MVETERRFFDQHFLPRTKKPDALYQKRSSADGWRLRPERSESRARHWHDAHQSQIVFACAAFVSMAFNSHIDAAILVQPFSLLHQRAAGEASRTDRSVSKKTRSPTFSTRYLAMPNRPMRMKKPNRLCGLARHMLQEPWYLRQMPQFFSKVNGGHHGPFE